MKRFEDIMVAITFAEAGEYDSAQKILGEREISIEKEENAESASVQTVAENT